MPTRYPVAIQLAAKQVIQQWDRVETLWVEVPAPEGLPGTCWLYQPSYPSHQTHPQLQLPTGQWVYWHRLIYYLTYGSNLEGSYLLHRCDRPHCGNPEHLHIGTEQDNIQERVARRLTQRPRPDGTLEPQWQARLRRDAATNRYTQSQLARIYRVSQGQVSKLLRRNNQR